MRKRASDLPVGRQAGMVTLKIPRPLYQRLQQLIEGTGFRSVTEFSVYVLRDLAAQPKDLPAGPSGTLRDRVGVQKGRQAGRAGRAASGRMTAAELDWARKRLQELGYL